MGIATKLAKEAMEKVKAQHARQVAKAKQRSLPKPKPNVKKKSKSK